MEEPKHLRGHLEVEVQEAFDLPNLDKNQGRPGNLSDPYVVVRVLGPKRTEKKLGRTHTIDDCLNPKWWYTLNAEIDSEVLEIRFDVKDEDTFRADKIGSCTVPVIAFINTGEYRGCLVLRNKKGESAGRLKICVRFCGNLNRQVVAASRPTCKIRGCVQRRRTCSIEDKNIIFHGKMIINIESAEDLPNLDSTFLNKENKTDPFVSAFLVDGDGQEWKVATTHCIKDELNPVWGETFIVNVCHEITSIVFKVYDQDFIFSEKVSSLTLPVSLLMNQGSISGRFELKGNHRYNGRLNVSIRFKNINVNDLEVPNCIYPLRSGNKVKLYQDAHCPSLPVPVFNDQGWPYIPNSAWIDIQDTLNNAKNFILITGWSVKTSIALVRGECGAGESLGELLKRKAGQGVDVRLLLWDEITSSDSNHVGAMSTYDNETKDYFKNSAVKVSLALRNRKNPRASRTNQSYLTMLCYTHHQKSIISDMRLTDSPKKNHRCLVAYVGGLDLTIGRYDTPKHSIFSTLNDEHKHDFYNNILNTNIQSGPRQPWHDIHSQIIGPVVHDILDNFIERWRKQGIFRDAALDCRDIDANFYYEGDDYWNAQIFRSICEDSLTFRTADPENIITKQGRKIDNSLHRAYIHQIQASEKFVYLENQYFIGSSHMWKDCRDTPVRNLVPLEIAKKIVDKIRKGEEFVAYIVFPMFPEGNPVDVVTQEILHWQYHTMEMMYGMIGNTIQEMGHDTTPQDYLLFFCLGLRVGPASVPQNLTPPTDEAAALSFKNRRSMIYVHSKLAIFDDNYIIVGSANINDRSLAGARDTEIAMGAYQPKVGPRVNNDIATFRKCLWSEHLGSLAPLELDPGSILCARKVRRIAEDSLMRYIDVQKPLPLAHLLSYPLSIDRRGVVTSRPDCEFFPDTKAMVLGTRSKVLPSFLTT
ncbi:phospholipase D alpha 1-like [Hyalella azteca]|uniref:phospholipase D n=1 Tax=Hyalella azteca TaxID=294128 RepID=A0A979FW92_HYAAZ|nr:phospholipase D alpha 1-like [Hyalella azteca]